MAFNLAPPSSPVFICPEISMDTNKNETVMNVINLIFNLKYICFTIGLQIYYITMILAGSMPRL